MIERSRRPSLTDEGASSCSPFSLKWGALLLAAVIAGSVNLGAVTVSVSEFSHDTRPSETIDDQFTLFNGDATAVSGTIRVVDWDVAEDGTTQILDPGTVRRSCATWLTVSHREVVLAPDGDLTVSWQATIPEDVHGTYWAGVLIDLQSSGSGSGLGDPVRQFLIRIFFNVHPATAVGRISDVQILGHQPLGVQIVFANGGDLRLTEVTGLVAIESADGHDLFEIELIPFDVLPGRSKHQAVYGTWPLIDAGLYLVRAVLDFGAEYLVGGQTVFRVTPLSLAPLRNDEALPRDLNGDGRYEDVNGDGTLSPEDAQVLHEHLESSAVQNNVRAFDFNNDGRITREDVDSLLALVSSASE